MTSYEQVEEYGLTNIDYFIFASFSIVPVNWIWRYFLTNSAAFVRYENHRKSTWLKEGDESVNATLSTILLFKQSFLLFKDFLYPSQCMWEAVLEAFMSMRLCPTVIHAGPHVLLI